jgi:electron-transferring-flavoprotein dehydrogenase
MKHHPWFKDLLSGNSTRLAYGGRTLNEGGYQSIPKLSFPGGALIGCSAGFVNVPKIKGTHNAMKTGMLAAETAFESVAEERVGEEGTADMSRYEDAFKSSWVNKELWQVRNIRPSFNTTLGIWGGIMYSGVDTLFLKGRVPWTFKHHGSDAAHTGKAQNFKPIDYPPFEAPLSTDLMTSVSLTGTNHAEDQPVHLLVRKPEEQAEETAKRMEHVKRNVEEYAGLLGRACPAGVYEYVDAEGGSGAEDGSWNGKKLVINSQVRVCWYGRWGKILTPSLFRTVSIVNCAILKSRLRTFSGVYPKAEEGQSTVSAYHPPTPLQSLIQPTQSPHLTNEIGGS